MRDFAGERLNKLGRRRREGGCFHPMMLPLELR